MRIDLKHSRAIVHGNGSISGNVLIEGQVPTNKFLVILYCNNYPVDSTLTDSTGQYAFTNLDSRRKYDVVAHDPSGVWESKISTRRQPG